MVLVTGSNASIGDVTAHRFAAEGAWVVINGRTRQRVDRALEKLRGEARGAVLDGIAVNCSTEMMIVMESRRRWKLQNVQPDAEDGKIGGVCLLCVSK